MFHSRYNKLAAQSNPANGAGAVGGTKFTVDSRLAADSFVLAQWSLCELRRFDDKRYDWLMLVPKVVNCIEFLDLSEVQQQQLAQETKLAAQLLKHHGRGNKLNIGALGNVVSQLHVHLVLRAEHDPAWPGPVWGHSPAQRFNNDEKHAEIKRWQALL